MTIELLQFVGKKVEVTLRNGETEKGKIEIRPREENVVSNPYLFLGDFCCSYLSTGRRYHATDTEYDIIKIEELQMNRYEKLEKKVAEMQKEIDRLKAQEQKKVPKIRCIQVTRTVSYVPYTYLQYCKESGVIPTQEGFIDYIADEFDKDFVNEYYAHQEIKELNEWN